ncbi:MAG: hypothetical protein Ct9H300mP1_29130 [Planctomycetaceae bacterium]|nr:MAG: hypothetical protein Ct9H300mP1_29130 [Planctomycetaceae bacterium]
MPKRASRSGLSPTPQERIRRVAASPDNKLVASVSDDMQVKVGTWPAVMKATLKEHKPMTPHNYPSMLTPFRFPATASGW